MQNRMKFLCCLLLSALAAALLYIFLHELGHCIAALACGAEITDFSVLTAHMSSSGGTYTDGASMWLYANGALFPLLLSYGYALLYRRESKSIWYRVFSYLAVLLPAGGLLAWVLVPLLFLSGNAPAGDDCTNFLEVFSKSGSPLLVIAGALALIVLSAVLIVKRGILRNFIDTVKSKQ